MREEKKAPKLRFKGFSDAWEQRKLDSIVDRLKSYSLARDVETSDYTGYKYIHYGDIHRKVADVIDESSDLPNIKTGNYELLEKGDLVLADASEDYQGIATPAVITIKTPYKLVAGLHTIALRPKQVDSLFLYYLINSPIFRKYGYKTGTGMKVFGINITNILKFESRFPLLEEQNKIGNLLKQLDDTIALHQQKLDKLKEQKRAYLVQILNQKIRFSGFLGDWEQRKLKEFGKATGGTSIESEFVEDGKYKIISIGSYSENSTYTDQGIRVNPTDKTKTRILNKDDLTMILNDKTISGRIIGRVLLIDQDDLYIYNQRTERIEVDKNKFSSQFLFQLLNADSIRSKIIRAAQGNTQIYVNWSSISEVDYLLPARDEQTKIGSLFKQLDEIISLHQAKIDKMNKIKQGFSQKMFI